MVTQADVAKKAGVSFITVSRVLNNRGYVKKETREKILKTIEELNYYTNHIGRSLRKKSVNTIGVVIPEPPNIPVHGMEYYNMIMQGIDRFAVSNGYDILLSTYKQNDPKVDYCRLYFQRKVDGLILFIPDMRYLKTNHIVKRNIPCVIVGERPIDARIDYVDADNYEGMYKAANYLLSRGLKKIFFVKGKSHMQNSIDRINGFFKAMNETNINVPFNWIFDGDYTIVSGVNIMKNIISSKNIPDAIIFSNDHMAIGAVTEAKKANISIPENLSIIGFDDINISALIDPPLSTVKQPLFDMGFTASEILFKKIQVPDAPPVHKIFPVELIIRKSII